MATTLQRLLSGVQSDLGDITFDKIQRAEYLDFAGDIMRSIGNRCRIWINSVDIVPLPSLDYTYTTDADRLAATGFAPADVGKIAYVSDDDTYWTLTAVTPTWASLDPYVAIIPAGLTTQYLLAVKRNGNHATEYSWQAVNTWNAEGRAFDINYTQFDGRQFNTKKNDDESVNLYFAYRFEVGETVSATVISNHPWPLLQWRETTIIPDFIEEALSTGMLYLALRRLSVQGDAQAGKSLKYIADEHDKAFRALEAYTRMFTDQRSVILIQPMNFLPE